MPNESVAQRRLRENADVAQATHSDLFDYLSNKLHRVSIDGIEYYLAEGDTLLDADQLRYYALQRQAEAEARKAALAADSAGVGTARIRDRSLTAMTQGGRIVRWKPGTILTYRVIGATFVNAGDYELVVDCMRKATQEWESTCGVKFQHMQELDGRPGISPEGALFAVREIDTGGRLIASAFFPNDPKDRRRLIVDPSFYATDFDKVGVLRHELGHVLGFRHEHIRSEAPPACPNEDDFDREYLTKYDPTSVMHYFCGEVGNKLLQISLLDREGARAVYGPPLTSLHFVA